MLQINNTTPFVTHLSLFPDENGVDTVYPTIKATFQLNGDIRLADEQQEIAEADQYADEPGNSSLLRASEVMPLKPATDFYLIGHAYAPGKQAVPELDVSIAINEKINRLRVIGDRIWKDAFFGASASKPIPFEKMELCFERAYGGQDVTRKGVEVSFAANPIGKGYMHSKSERRIDGLHLPNIENPDKLIKRPQDQPEPVGFFPLPACWEPRLNYAGTYDETWERNRAPYLPKDFNLRFYNAGQPNLVFSPYLSGSEQIELINLSPSGRLNFKLPEFRFNVKAQINGELLPIDVLLETVCVEPDESRLTMIWKGRQSCDKQTLKIEQVFFDFAQIDTTVKGLQ